MKTLLQAGADPNVADCEGLAPLIAACEISPPNMEVVKKLLEAGADPARGTKRGEVALWSAAYEGSPDLVRLVL